MGSHVFSPRQLDSGGGVTGEGFRAQDLITSRNGARKIIFLRCETVRPSTELQNVTLQLLSPPPPLCVWLPRWRAVLENKLCQLEDE